MKITCDVIKDLLPLYHDDVCSLDSCQMIEEHIDKCEECRVELEKYDIEMKGVNNMLEAKPLMDIRKRWKTDKKKSFIKGMALVSIIGAVISSFIYHVDGNYIDENGFLVESFGFIPLTFFLGLIALVSISILLVDIIARNKKKASLNKN